MIHGKKLDKDNIKSFILAGNATFTILNTYTKNRFTFKLHKSKSTEIFYLSVLTGSDNESNYTYLGFIKDGSLLHGGRKTSISKDATIFKSIDWVLRHVNVLPENVEVWHEGKCGKCGRKLTVPSSIESGLGPECRKFKK